MFFGTLIDLHKTPSDRDCSIIPYYYRQFASAEIAFKLTSGDGAKLLHHAILTKPSRSLTASLK